MGDRPADVSYPLVAASRVARRCAAQLQCKGFAKRIFLACLHNFFNPEADIMTGVLGEATIRELDADLSGCVVSPGNPDYGSARRIWNAAIDKRPALIVRAASTEDVVRAVGFARSEGRPIA